MPRKKKIIKEYIKVWKKYENKPTDKNFVNFLSTAIDEYTRKVCGIKVCLRCLGFNDLDDFIRKDIKFREWFKKEFYYWLKFEDNGELVLIDTRLSGLKYNEEK